MTDNQGDAVRAYGEGGPERVPYPGVTPHRPHTTRHFMGAARPTVEGELVAHILKEPEGLYRLAAVAAHQLRDMLDDKAKLSVHGNVLHTIGTSQITLLLALLDSVASGERDKMNTKAMDDLRAFRGDPVEVYGPNMSPPEVLLEALYEDGHVPSVVLQLCEADATKTWEFIRDAITAHAEYVSLYTPPIFPEAGEAVVKLSRQPNESPWLAAARVPEADLDAALEAATADLELIRGKIQEAPEANDRVLLKGRSWYEVLTSQLRLRVASRDAVAKQQQGAP